ncbi:hypothetical protein AtDm6_1630 [Acetobacter tropicalis]|uniref:Uncharacterized protein n=1 Tax=Acetobacter tropicalis TaxID=104102 RepID=A0A094YMS8_9PROT|nr:hypothetical protein AtDm6_1630 [Acetobacter tropicalis]
MYFETEPDLPEMSASAGSWRKPDTPLSPQIDSVVQKQTGSNACISAIQSPSVIFPNRLFKWPAY